MSFKHQFRSLLIAITPGPVKRIRKSISLYNWYSKTYCAPPAPHFVKQSLLLRHGIKNCTWIETGTYLGSTTKMLSSKYHHVHTIEPSQKCLSIAKDYIGSAKNITFYNGTSEDCIETACAAVEGDVCFWLDGHYSAGITFQGDADTPIVHELATIGKYLNRYRSVVLIIDDIRCSHLDSDHYPSLNFYVEWSNRNNLNWTIEHDSFIAKSRNLEVYPDLMP